MQATKSDNGKKLTLFGRSWDRIVLDEGHAIRNKATGLYKAAMKLATETNIKWVLSATPMQNKRADMEAIKNWIGIEVKKQALSSRNCAAGIGQQELGSRNSVAGIG